MLYKIVENGYNINSSSLTCDDVMTYQMLLNIYNVNNLKSEYKNTSFHEFIDQSRKFFLDGYYYAFLGSPSDNKNGSSDSSNNGNETGNSMSKL